MHGNRIKTLADNFNNTDLFKILAMILTLLLLIPLTIVLFGAIVGMFVYGLRYIFGTAAHSILYYGLIDPAGRKLTICVLLVFIITALIADSPDSIKNNTVTQDVRGVNFMEKGTFGTSKWMTPEEAAKKYTVKPITRTRNTVYGQFTQDGGSVVAYKGSIDSLQNNLVIGSPGTGKSFSFVRTELIQSIYRGDSVICTDPSGELYTSMASFCKRRGVDVKVLNLADPEYSDFWNCLDETVDPETERLDGTRLNEFVSIYMQNSSDGKEDQFWFNSTNNLLKAIIGYVAWLHESAVISDLILVYDKVAATDPDWSVTRSAFREMISIRWCKDRIREAAERNGFDLNKIEELFRTIENNAPKRTIGEVFRYVRKFKDIVSEFETMPDDHPGKISYQIFQQNASESVQGSALQGTSMRLQLFTDEKMSSMLSRKGIDLQNINTKQSAYFLIMSDKSTATKPIASLFFSFFFKDAQDNWDKAAGIAKERGYSSPAELPEDDPFRRVPVTVMLDEFFSIGVIGGSPSAFTVTMSNSRKRCLHVNIIVQALPQVAALYGSDNANTIFTDCSTVIFLGCNDLNTAEFISKFAGEATVLSESHQESAGRTLFNTAANNNVNISSSKRPLLTVDEVRRFGGVTDSSLRKVLVIKSGEHPLELTAFPYTEHPAYRKGLLKEVDIKNMIKPISARMAEIKMAENQTVTDGMGTTYDRDLVKEGIISLVSEDQKDTGQIPDRLPDGSKAISIDTETGELLTGESDRSMPVEETAVPIPTVQRRRRKRSRTVNTSARTNIKNSSEFDD